MCDSGEKKEIQKPSYILYMITTLRHNKLYVKKKNTILENFSQRISLAIDHDFNAKSAFRMNAPALIACFTRFPRWTWLPLGNGLCSNSIQPNLNPRTKELLSFGSSKADLSNLEGLHELHQVSSMKSERFRSRGAVALGLGERS